MSRWRAGMLAVLLTLGMATAAGAQTLYAGSARVTPFLVSAHMQLALDHLRLAQDALVVERGGRETVTGDMRPVRQALAAAADELTLARMATADPDQIRAIDGMLMDLDRARELLDRRVLGAPLAMRRLEQDMLGLHRTARSQIALREEAILREESPRPAIR